MTEDPKQTAGELADAKGFGARAKSLWREHRRISICVLAAALAVLGVVLSDITSVHPGKGNEADSGASSAPPAIANVAAPIHTDRHASKPGSGAIVVKLPTVNGIFSRPTQGTKLSDPGRRENDQHVSYNSISCPTSSDCVAVGATQGQQGLIARTTDGGEDWTTTPEASVPPLENVNCPTPTNCVAGGDGVVLASHNMGASWTAAASRPAFPCLCSARAAQTLCSAPRSCSLNPPPLAIKESSCVAPTVDRLGRPTPYRRGPLVSALSPARSPQSASW